MVRRFLFPRYEREFPAFRAEVERLAVLGLRVIAAVCVGASSVSVLLMFLVLPSAPDFSMLATDSSQIVVGSFVLYLSFRRWIGPYARGFGVFIGALIASIQSAGVLVERDLLETILQADPKLPSG